MPPHPKGFFSGIETRMCEHTFLVRLRFRSNDIALLLPVKLLARHPHFLFSVLSRILWVNRLDGVFDPAACGRDSGRMGRPGQQAEGLPHYGPGPAERRPGSGRKSMGNEPGSSEAGPVVDTRSLQAHFLSRRLQSWGGAPLAPGYHAAALQAAGWKPTPMPAPSPTKFATEPHFSRCDPASPIEALTRR